jgi:pimeloyl-ACP methyl ester carboxylesterase
MYRTRLSGASLVVFERSAHLPMLGEPELYLKTLREFLRGVDSH